MIVLGNVSIYLSCVHSFSLILLVYYIQGLLYVQTPTVLFGTMHLESFVDAQRYNGVEQRELQIEDKSQYRTPKKGKTAAHPSFVVGVP